MDRIYETAYCKYWITDGILFCQYKAIDYIDIAIARSIVSSRIQFQENEAYLIFCDTRGLKDSTKIARDYLAREGSVLATAIAIYDDRNLSASMLHYYLLRNKPLVPTQIFTGREEALEFLKKIEVG